MPVLLQFDFPAEGPWGHDMTEAFSDLAKDIATTPGFRWKIWTENESSGEQGGIYLFDDEESARAYMTMHTERLQSFGVRDIRAKVFQVNEGLSEIDNGPIDHS